MDWIIVRNFSMLSIFNGKEFLLYESLGKNFVKINASLLYLENFIPPVS